MDCFVLKLRIVINTQIKNRIFKYNLFFFLTLKKILPQHKTTIIFLHEVLLNNLSRLVKGF